MTTTPTPAEPLKPYGYAPGNYTKKCLFCDSIMRDVDKSATHCRYCAEEKRATSAAAAEPVPFKPETWPVDADGDTPTLCTVCGTPVRYGSRHTKCAPGWKATEIAQPATPEPLTYAQFEAETNALPDDAFDGIEEPPNEGGDHRAKQIAFMGWLTAKLSATQASAPQVVEPIPKGYIVIDKELLAQAIFTNTDASLAEARHIINTTLKVSDSPVYRAAGDEA